MENIFQFIIIEKKTFFIPWKYFLCIDDIFFTETSNPFPHTANMQQKTLKTLMDNLEKLKHNYSEWIENSCRKHCGKCRYTKISLHYFFNRCKYCTEIWNICYIVVRRPLSTGLPFFSSEFVCLTLTHIQTLSDTSAADDWPL